ncbi:MAG: spermidine/putrescine ABC transporter, partial [Rikenellaceae bacterium]
YEIGYVTAVATPEILEAIDDEEIDNYSDLSYLFGPEADSVRVDHIQYPDVSVIERCAMSRDFGERTEAMMIMWATVKGDNLSGGMIAVIVVTALGIIIYYLYQRYTAYSRRRYRKRRK